MRARHRYSKRQREAHRIGGGGVTHHPHNTIRGEGDAPKLHAGKRARGGGVKRADGGPTQDPAQNQSTQSRSPAARTAAVLQNVLGMKPPPGKKSGGGHWIKGAIRHPGGLHRALGVPEGEKIPAKKLAKAGHSENPRIRRMASLAKTLKHMHH